MYELNKEKARDILTSELGYKPEEAMLYLEDYPPIHGELAESVKQWLEDRSILDISVYGLTITEIMRTRRCHFLMAVRELNRLLDDDLSPERRDRLAEIIRKRAIQW